MPREYPRGSPDDRAFGRTPNGTVSYRDFHEGVLLQTGAKLLLTGPQNVPGLFVTVPGVAPPPDSPGVPVTFGNPESFFRHKRLPFVCVNCDDLPFANQRLHPLSTQYRAPARRAQPAQLGDQTGYTRVVVREQAQPYDLSYSVSAYCTRRGGGTGVSDDLLKLQHYLAKRFPPYGGVIVRDSLGDERVYDCYSEMGQSPDEQLLDVVLRYIGVFFTLRVEAEIDLMEEEELSTVIDSLTRRLAPR